MQWQNFLQFNVLNSTVAINVCTSHPLYVDLLQDCIQIILKDSRKESITINIPLILKVRDIIFFSRAKDIMEHFAGFFEGAETFLTPKLS